MTSQRADYYGELQANTALFRRTEKIDVPPLDAEGLTQVLREPARVLGVTFESDSLIEQIVQSAEDQPGALPLLADLFTDLWERMRERGDGVLRVSDRREIIQVGAALAQRADQFLERYPDRLEAVKRLFTLRLAHVPRQGEPVRARWERDVKAEDAEWALVEELAGPDWRLLVAGEKDGRATAEVAHEILLKTWPTLARWLEDEREFLVWRGELAALQEQYETVPTKQKRQALLSGLQLDAAEKWLAARQGDIDASAVGYIQASTRADRAVARRWQWLQASVGILMLLVIAGMAARMNEQFLWQQYFWARYAWGHALTPEQAQTLKPGASFRECARESGIDADASRFADYSVHCPEMVVVPAGTFRMGSNTGDRDERPAHMVTISKPFAVSKFEITAEQWQTCVTYGGCTPGGGKRKQPANSMNWHDAQRYVAWLSRMTGHQYRLLSEAEWEYAARAGSQTAYWWGDDIRLDGKAMAACRGCGSQWDGKNAAPVGSFAPNKFGLYDMSGNVWEWVADNWHENYKGAPQDGSVWPGGDPPRRVVRGGSWGGNPQYLRSAFRDGYLPDDRDYSLGFRVARTLTP